MESRGSLVYELVRLVRPMTLNSARAVEAGLRPFGLTVGRRAVLEILVERGLVPVPEIARALTVSRQAAQRMVNELLESGYATAVANPRHSRSQLIEVTAAGRSVFAEVRSSELELLEVLAPEMSQDDLTRALAVLSAIARDIRRNALHVDEIPVGGHDHE